MTRWIALAVVVLLAFAAWQFGPWRAGGLTFSRDIAPIVFENCAPCHHEGGAGPFPLLTYRQVRKHASQIREVTASRFMPPWLPEPGYGDFAHTRRLGDEDLERLQRWAGGGAPEGDPNHLPPTPEFPDGWQLGEPDLVVQLDRPFELRAEKPDVFRTFVLPVPLTEPRYVRAVEIRPGSPKYVHHVTLTIDDSRTYVERDALDPEPGFEGMLTAGAEFPDGHFLGWTPGKVVSEYEDLAWRLMPGTHLILEAHMLPSGKLETVQPVIGFYFTDRVPERTPFSLRLGSRTIDIAAGDAEYGIADNYVLPVDVKVIRVYPHAHYVGSRMTAWATRPDGTREWLLYIKEWDFNWQDEYQYREPPTLPAGTQIDVRYEYDNSARNERNPHDPPRRVSYGPNSTDEMADFILQVITETAEEREILANDFLFKAIYADLQGMQRAVSIRPDDPIAKMALASLYAKLGRTNAAARLYRDVIALDERHFLAHSNLGMMYAQAGRHAEAVEPLQRAASLNRQAVRPRFWLANSLQDVGRVAEAIPIYRELTAQRPDDRMIGYQLARALAADGQFAAALEHVEAMRQAGSFPALDELRTRLRSQLDGA